MRESASFSGNSINEFKAGSGRVGFTVSALQPQSGGRAQSAGEKPTPAVAPPQKSAMQAETNVKKWRTPRGRRCSVLPDRLSIVSTTLESSPALRVSAAQAKVVDLAATNCWDTE